MSVVSIGAVSPADSAVSSAPVADSPHFKSTCNASLDRSEFSFDEFHDVFIIGDIHGDHAAMYAALCCTEQVVPSGTTGGLRWAGRSKKAIVILGDCVDRWRKNVQVKYDETPAGWTYSFVENGLAYGVTTIKLTAAVASVTQRCPGERSTT
jgi:hypothetical protein